MKQVSLQIACSPGGQIPSVAQFVKWVGVVLTAVRSGGGEITIRVVDPEEMAGLNSRYRGKDSPTNVLSFPFEAPEGVPATILGDLVVCAQVVSAEAASQGKRPVDHWAHMTIHGTLHLCGFDHQTDDEASEMESLEQRIMADLGIPNPYATPYE